MSIAANAQAAEPLELEWRAPPECPQEDAVRAKIRALVPSTAQADRRVRAEGRIERVRGRFRLRFSVQFGAVRGQRDIESDRCGDLAGAAAVTLGLLLESTAANPTSTPTPDADAGSESSAARDPSEDRTSVSDQSSVTKTAEFAEPERRGRAERDPSNAKLPRSRSSRPTSDLSGESIGAVRDLRWHLQAPLLISRVGLLQHAELGTAGAVGAESRGWRLTLGAQVFFPQTLVSERVPGLTVRVARAGLDALACRSWRAHPWALGPCASVGLDWLSARGSGPSITSRSEHSVWLSVGLTGLAQWQVSKNLSLIVLIGGRVEGQRPRISIDGVGEVYRLGPASLLFKAGPEWFF